MKYCLLPCACSCVVIRLRLHQIVEREYEYPDHVDEVPVQAGVFDAVGGVLAEHGPQRDDREDGQPAQDVEAVEAGDYEEGCRKLRYAPGILRQGCAFTDEVRPLEDLTT